MAVNYGAFIYTLLGMTPLHFSVQIGDVKSVKWLLENRADVNHRSKDGIAALHIAAAKKENLAVELCDLLLQFRACPNISNVKGITPLHFAVQKNNLKIIELLLRNNADVNKRTKDFVTPLMIAVKNRNPEVCKMLTKFGADVKISDIFGNSLLHLAVSQDSCQAPTLNCELWEVFKQQPKQKKKAKKNVAKEGEECLKIVKILLKAGGDPNVMNRDKKSPLHFAILDRNHEATKLMLEHNGDVHKKTFRGVSPIYLSAKYADLKMCRVLLKYGAEANSSDCEGTSPLHLSVGRCRYKTSELLINSGASVNQRTKDGVTPLYIAAAYRYAPICDLLLRNGGDPNVCDKEGDTALHAALRVKESEISLKCDDSLLGRLQYTTLYMFFLFFPWSQFSSINAIPSCLGIFVMIFNMLFSKKLDDLRTPELLLLWGADPNRMNRSGFTPLHAGVERNCAKTVNLLLSFNADPCHRFGNHKSALHFALFRKRMSIFKILLEKSTRISANELVDMSRLASSNGYSDFGPLLVSHVIKCNPFESYTVLPRFPRDSAFCLFQEQCEAEVYWMKNECVTGRFLSISFYDLVTGTTDELAYYLKKDNLRAALETHNWRKRYPIYEGLIVWKLEKAEKRKEEIEKLERVFGAMVPSLPKLCVEKIVDCFTDRDRKNSLRLLQPDLYYWSF